MTRPLVGRTSSIDRRNAFNLSLRIHYEADPAESEDQMCAIRNDYNIAVYYSLIVKHLCIYTGKNVLEVSYIVHVRCQHFLLPVF